MPRTNTEDRSRVGAYHVYNRGRNRRQVFIDDTDRNEFLGLVGRFARAHAQSIEVVAYCPMGTHFHLIVWQKRAGGLGAFMASLMNAYVRYFNNRHGFKGALFQGPYRARHLATAKKFKWAVVYVHDNHRDGVSHRFSSHTAYVDPEQRPAWLAVEPALRVFGGSAEYARYVAAIASR